MTSPPRRFANTHPDVVIGNFPWYEMVWRSLRGDFKPRSEPAGGYAAFARQWTQPVDPARLAQRQQAPVITWLGHVSMLLQVEDSGPGVPEAERELVFQPFYRALGSEADGSGLGLPIVLEIASKHDAEVTLEDARPGQTPPGARFSVRFAARDVVAGS